MHFEWGEISILRHKKAFLLRNFTLYVILQREYTHSNQFKHAIRVGFHILISFKIYFSSGISINLPPRFFLKNEVSLHQKKIHKTLVVSTATTGGSAFELSAKLTSAIVYIEAMAIHANMPKYFFKLLFILVTPFHSSSVNKRRSHFSQCIFYIILSR